MHVDIVDQFVESNKLLLMQFQHHLDYHQFTVHLNTLTSLSICSRVLAYAFPTYTNKRTD